MSFILGWLWKKYGGRKSLKGVREFWFGDGRPAAGWIEWYWWRRAWLMSWASFIVMVWVFLIGAVTKVLEMEALTFWMYGISGLLIIGNFVPACLALWDEKTRYNLLRQPTALMFIVFIGSLMVSLGIIGILGVSWHWAVSGLVIGLAMFVLSFGIALPLGVPLAAAIWTWATVRHEGEVSVRYAWGMGVICGLGWLMTAGAGMIAGQGG